MTKGYSARTQLYSGFSLRDGADSFFVRDLRLGTFMKQHAA